MDKKEQSSAMKLEIIRDDDPLGIKEVSLGGGFPSLAIEAIIAKRQYEANNGHNCKGELDGRLEGKS